MYEIHKVIEISGAHWLTVPYESKCSNLHGHNWLCTIVCRVNDGELNESGMVIDFAHVSQIVKQFDHKCLNDFLTQPTAELFAKYLCDLIPYCVRVEIEETRGNKVIYERSDKN